MTLFSFLVALFILLIGLVFLCVAVSSLLSVFGGAQFVASPHGIHSEIINLAQLAPGERFVELGSGNGSLCRFVAAHTPARVTGIDINPLLILYARWRTRRNPDVHFTWGNLRSVDLAHVDVVFCYLLPPLLRKLTPHFATQLPRGARVISYAFPLPDKEPATVHRANPNHGALYLYQY